VWIASKLRRRPALRTLGLTVGFSQSLHSALPPRPPSFWVGIFPCCVRKAAPDAIQRPSRADILTTSSWNPPRSPGEYGGLHGESNGLWCRPFVGAAVAVPLGVGNVQFFITGKSDPNPLGRDINRGDGGIWFGCDPPQWCLPLAIFVMEPILRPFSTFSMPPSAGSHCSAPTRKGSGDGPSDPDPGVMILPIITAISPRRPQQVPRPLPKRHRGLRRWQHPLDCQSSMVDSARRDFSHHWRGQCWPCRAMGRNHGVTMIIGTPRISAGHCWQPATRLQQCLANHLANSSGIQVSAPSLCSLDSSMLLTFTVNILAQWIVKKLQPSLLSRSTFSSD